MPLIPPTPNWDASPLRCVYINDEWLSFIVGVLERAQSENWWDSDQQRGAQSVHRFADFFAQGDCNQMPTRTFQAEANIEHIEDQNVSGGGYSAGTQTYPLNFIATSDAAIIGLDDPNNHITLLAGRYYLTCTLAVISHATIVTNVQAYLRDTVNSNILLRSLSHRMAADQRGYLHMAGFFDLSGAHALEILFQASQARATNGLGLPSNFGTEVYAEIFIGKLWTS